MIWPYLTVEQLAAIAQLSEKTVRRAINRDELHAFRCGTRVRIREDDARAGSRPSLSAPSLGQRHAHQGCPLDTGPLSKEATET